MKETFCVGRYAFVPGVDATLVGGPGRRQVPRLLLQVSEPDRRRRHPIAVPELRNTASHREPPSACIRGGPARRSVRRTPTP